MLGPGSPAAASFGGGGRPGLVRRDGGGSRLVRMRSGWLGVRRRLRRRRVVLRRRGFGGSGTSSAGQGRIDASASAPQGQPDGVVVIAPAYPVSGSGKPARFLRRRGVAAAKRPKGGSRCSTRGREGHEAGPSIRAHQGFPCSSEASRRTRPRRSPHARSTRSARGRASEGAVPALTRGHLVGSSGRSARTPQGAARPDARPAVRGGTTQRRQAA